MVIGCMVPIVRKVTDTLYMIDHECHQNPKTSSFLLGLHPFFAEVEHFTPL